MNRRLRRLLAAEAGTYVIAALVHAGILLRGYEHRNALIAESLIAAALLAGWVVARVRPQSTRIAGLWAQGLALFWTMVGLLTIAIGVGPQSIPDVVYHVAIVSVLVYGLSRNRPSPRHPPPGLAVTDTAELIRFTEMINNDEGSKSNRSHRHQRRRLHRAPRR